MMPTWVGAGQKFNFFVQKAWLLFGSIKLDENNTLARTSIRRYSETFNLNQQSLKLRASDKRQCQYKNWILKIS